MKTWSACPKCGWCPDCDKEYKVGGSVLRKISGFTEVGGGADYSDWYEHFCCPRCKVYFVMANGT